MGPTVARRRRPEAAARSGRKVHFVFLMLPEQAHVQVAVRFQPSLMSFHGHSTD